MAGNTILQARIKQPLVLGKRERGGGRGKGEERRGRGIGFVISYLNMCVLFYHKIKPVAW